MSIKRLVDFAIYISIGLAVVFAAIVLAEADIAEEEMKAWTQYARGVGYTAILFVVTAQSRRKYLGIARLWVFLLTLLLIHSVCIGLLIWGTGGWSLLFALILGPLEYALFDAILRRQGFPGSLHGTPEEAGETQEEIEEREERPDR